MKKILFIFAFLSACSEQSNTSQDFNALTQVETTVMTTNDLIRYHEVPAVLIATNRANLAFQLTGTIDKVLVKIGEQVEADQVLMGLYNPNLNPTVLTNLANMDSIKAQIAQTKRDVADIKELRKNNSASKTAYELKRTELKNLLAQKKSTQAQIDLAKANQQESFIHAPYDSTIVSVNKQVGEFVVAGQVVIEVNQTDKQEVEVELTKNLWKGLEINDSVNGIYEEQNVEFEVVEISKVANKQSHLYKVILQLKSNLDTSLGQQVILKFAEKYDNVYKMPLEIVVDDGINEPYIFINENNIAQKITIEPIYIDGNSIVFKLLQKITDPVVSKGQSKISVGMKISTVQ